MQELDAQFWMTIVILAGIAAALLRDLARPDLIFLSGLAILLVLGVITPADAFAGFSNSAVLAVGALFVVAAGIEETGAVRAFDRMLFGSSMDLRWVLARVMLPTAGLSAFINNTPIVAMLTPRIQHWAQRVGVAPSKLLIPLSYAAIAGGMVTLIGTSTNIIVSGMLVEVGMPALGLFDMAGIGLAAVVSVIGFFTLTGFRLLPDRGITPTVEEGLGEYLFEVRVGADAPMIGQTIEHAGLRALRDAYLVHVQRQEHMLSAIPDLVLFEGDTLTFTGKAPMLEELLRRPGLERSVPLVEERLPRTRPLFDAVVSDTSNLVGTSLRDEHFRERYGAAVLAIQRRHERVLGPLGRVTIKAGDLLIIEANEGFDKRWNTSRSEFYLVTPRRADEAKRLNKKAPIALAILIAMVLAIGLRLLPVISAAFLAALAMIATGCLSLRMARRALNLEVLVLIAAALGLGQAVASTGLTTLLADFLLALSGLGVMAALMGLYVTTNMLTELVTHKAAAVLMLPVALTMAAELGVEPKAFALTVSVAAAASFMTPVGYHTNLMVMAAGEYRVRDYLRVGAPVSLIVMTAATLVIFFTWVA